jgi:hypothetical protein
MPPSISHTPLASTCAMSISVAGAPEGRGAAIGRVAAEQLLQPRIGEIAAQRAPERGVGAQVAVIGKAARAHPPAEGDRIGDGGAQERLIDGVEDALRLRSKGAVAAGVGRAREHADRGLAGGGIGEQVEAVVAPGVAGERGRRLHRQVVVERGAARVEDLRKMSRIVKTVGPPSTAASPAMTVRSLPPGPPAPRPASHRSHARRAARR